MESDNSERGGQTRSDSRETKPRFRNAAPACMECVMATPEVFEPRLVRARKRRALNGFHAAAFLHARVAADLADRLEAIPREFPRALALGGGGLFSAEIQSRAAAAPRGAQSANPGSINHTDAEVSEFSSNMDPGSARAPHAWPGNDGGLASRIGHILEADSASGDVLLDPEQLPFADGMFDLIVSPLALHWVNDLPGALIQLRRALKPDGLMLASMFGGQTLHELRLSLLEAESELTGGAGPRVAPFADLADVAGLLQRAGFALPGADRDVIVVRYAEPMRLLGDLRAMGQTAALAQRSPRGLSRRILARAFEIYRARFADPDGRVRATFEILNLTGWAPHESQQQPLKPGSAKLRLADALGAWERSAGEKAGS